MAQAKSLTVSQMDLLRWIADGCPVGVYEGSSHRVSARALHNRDLIRVSGSGDSWAAKLTDAGASTLKHDAERADAEREELARDARAKEERALADRRRDQEAAELLRTVQDAGGRLETSELEPAVMKQRIDRAKKLGLVPLGQRLAQEPTRMDPTLGITVYVEPDFASLTPVRTFSIPRQLREPLPAVLAFRSRRIFVSKDQIARGAIILHALALASAEMGWKVSRERPTGRRDPGPDLSLGLPSRELDVTLRELDNRGRAGRAFITQHDFYTNAQRTTRNDSFAASGRLELNLTRSWDDQTVLALKDTGESSLEAQLPALIHALETAEAEEKWAREEQARRGEISKLRWEEVKREAFHNLTLQRNTERLRTQIENHQFAAAARLYADHVHVLSSTLEGTEAEDAVKWAEWIRTRADEIEPHSADLRFVPVTTASHDDLQPHMGGWSTFGSYRS